MCKQTNAINYFFMEKCFIISEYLIKDFSSIPTTAYDRKDHLTFRTDFYVT